jgi:periplasmic protein CpxP/Spy
MKINTINRWMLGAALAGCLLSVPKLVAADSTAAPSDKPKAATNRPEGARADRARERIQEVAKELNLTDEQKEKIRPVLQAEAEKLRALRQDTNLSREERQAKVKEIRDDIAAKIKPILTAEQYDKWQKMRQQRREQRPPQRPQN